MVASCYLVIRRDVLGSLVKPMVHADIVLTAALPSALRGSTECRRRKKEHVVELQTQVARLEAENLRLKLQLKVGEESEAQERQEKERITKKLDDMVRGKRLIESCLKRGGRFGDLRRAWSGIHFLGGRGVFSGVSGWMDRRRSTVVSHLNLMITALLIHALSLAIKGGSTACVCVGADTHQCLCITFPEGPSTCLRWVGTCLLIS